MRTALIEGESGVKRAKMKQARTYHWSAVIRYVNRAAKGDMTPEQRAGFFRNAASAWQQMARAMSSEKRLIFLKKVERVFRNYRMSLPKWNPKIDATGNLIKPMNPDDVLSALVMQERIRAAHPDADPETRNAAFVALIREIEDWKAAVSAEAAKIVVSRGADYGERVEWRIEYPDGSTTRMEMGGDGTEEAVRAMATRNWMLWQRIEGVAPEARVRFANVTVAEVSEKLTAGATDDEIMDSLNLLQDDVDAVRLWVEETTT